MHVVNLYKKINVYKKKQKKNSAVGITWYWQQHCGYLLASKKNKHCAKIIFSGINVEKKCHLPTRNIIRKFGDFAVLMTADITIHNVAADCVSRAKGRDYYM